jgi:uncharacterized protein YdcH (DUF465 family)
MLGEVHSLVNEFPQHKETIVELNASDEAFASDHSDYNSLDKEIRILELNGSPVDDSTMNLLKHRRSELKDSLYARLVKAAK